MTDKTQFADTLRALKDCQGILRENGIVKTLYLYKDHSFESNSTVQKLINLCEDIASEFQMKG